MSEEELAKQRIAYIAKRQELLASAVTQIQAQLFEVVLLNLDAIMKDPATLEFWFNKFTKTTHAKVIQKFAVDIMQIGKLNEDYFKAVAEDVDAKDYKSIKKDVDQYLLDRFGLNASGSAVPDGFIDSFVKDPRIKRTLKEFAYKTQSTGGGLDEFKSGFRDLIIGTDQRGGMLERHYQTFAYDTYQQADAAIQEQYAKRLDLMACLYLGGEISGTRKFCKDRNGKVFLRDEIEAWQSLSFAGKPANYNPFLDRGGYNCRHHLNYISNKMAMRRRSDLYIDDKGVLRGGGKPEETLDSDAFGFDKESEILLPRNFKRKTGAEFKPAKTVKEAEDFAKANLKTKIDSFKGFDLDVANQVNRTLLDIESSFKDIPQTVIKSKVSGKAYAQYDWNDNAVNLRKRYENIESRRTDDNNAWRKQFGGDYHASVSLDGVIKHEFAHAFDNLTGRKLYKELQALPLEEKNQLFGISGYASSDRFYATGGSTEGSEMIAEVICAKLTKSNKYDRLPDSAKSIIDKYFN